MEESDRKHTPLPWKLSTLDKLHGEYSIYTGKNVNFADAVIANVAGGLGTYDEGCCESEANAEFIVKACNSHYGLVEVLKMAQAFIGGAISSRKHAEDRECLTKDLLDPIRAVLSEAE